MAEGTVKKSSWWDDWGKTILYAVLIALAIRATLFQPFNIPSSSMKPTLLIGDYLFVAKYSYGYSKHSLPFSPPIFSGRIFGSAPDRGDVVVFKTPKDNRTDYIKRVIGLPGDTVQMINGALYLNGQKVPRVQIEDFPLSDGRGGTQLVKRYRETLPNGVSYETLDLRSNGNVDDTRLFTVPEGHYFMMGDNRDNSQDSRAYGGLGMVPAENLVGKAMFRWLATKDGAPFFAVWAWRFDRMFESVH